MSNTNKNQATKVVTGEVRFSYLHVFEPHAIEEGQQEKYSVSLLIPKKDKATLNKIKKAIEAAKEAGKSTKFGGKIPANLKMPLRDGDVDRPDQEEYAGHYFINANSTNKPGIVDANVDPILDSTELYSGCYGRASVNFYAYSVSGNKGIACGLNNIQKLRDGDTLGGRSRAEDDFDAVEVEGEDEGMDDFLN
ncbi:DUF2815 family protein [Amphibacillus sp. MSJ-3]|uniref:DUF2815 family protein n=1 Tax=Amphibacillus sp. MSJ-3 TaxID=2841505 RepID=UPI001C0F1140|nr:DUF2815 family protein [Amphibacillus sp. MSJ-3]MBU5594892.1 DUF2815 family protein [Amphibacillus sp. MSJ-3]